MIEETLKKHKLWLEGKEGGVKANLSDADLSGANLSGANLSGANLSRANLYRADLSGACLSCANLHGAYLSRANLYRANLSGANLSRANLYRADLSGADLSDADLFGAKGIIRVGPSQDGYEFFGVVRDGVVWIKAGCRWFSASEARDHWEKTRKGTALGVERLVLVDAIEKLLLPTKGE